MTVRMTAAVAYGFLCLLLGLASEGNFLVALAVWVPASFALGMLAAPRP